MKKVLLFALLTGITITLIPQDLNHLLTGIDISFNGKFIIANPLGNYKYGSGNGVYKADYDIAEVTDEQRVLKNLKIFKNDMLLYTKSHVEGSDLTITNEGYLILYDHSSHYKGQLSIQVYDKNGSFKFRKSFANASLFVNSETGFYTGINSSEGFRVINLETGSSSLYPSALQADISNDGKTIAIAGSNYLSFYLNGNIISTIPGNFIYTRGIKLNPTGKFAATIDKRNLKVYEISNANILFSKTIDGNFSFRDLKFEDDKIVTGVHQKEKGYSAGIIKVYDLTGNCLIDTKSNERSFEDFSSRADNFNQQDSIQWPFIPFDSMHTVWNHYEQHMGGYESSYSYLHQGLDIITPIAEKTYAVEPGIVKLVLTLGGDIYWRTAISPENVIDSSNGWLYAHLIPTSIQVDIGDTVELHDYLGDIVQWSDDWGHIHFVEIRDSGYVWQFDDDEWGINFNPLNKLKPNFDPYPPEILNCFDGMKFGFCKNDTSIYIISDTLKGDVDIIVNVNDYIGESNWSQPAYKIIYSIKRINDGVKIIDRKLSHVLNHPYPFYTGDFYEPFATVLYQRDETFFPEYWMDTLRRYHHNITNSDGDSIINLEEKSLSLKTADYSDGAYRIIVEAYDQYGNMDIDSMDVYFKNITVDINDEISVGNFSLEQNYPNPFNPATTIAYSLPRRTEVNITLYDILGSEVKVLVNREQESGRYEVTLDGSGLSSGIYFYKIKAGEFTASKKLVILK